MSENRKVDVSVIKRLEGIFAHAVALEQSGRFKNTIFMTSRFVYILNTDHTVLLRFETPPNTTLPFSEPVGFRANDYDSARFSVQGETVKFHQKGKTGYEREKTCATVLSPDPQTVTQLFLKLYRPFKQREQELVRVVHSKDILTLINEQLSHLEWTEDGKGNGLLIQRDLYSGNRIQIKSPSRAGMLQDSSRFPAGWGPVGMRTNDFFALFSFQDAVTFSFLPETESREAFCLVSGDRMGMKGLLSFCLYDEMGGITYSSSEETEEDLSHGRREKPKKRCGK